MRSKVYNIYALLWIDRDSEKEISNVLKKKCGISEEYIQRGMHLTIYHGKRKLPRIKPSTTYEIIKSNVNETRFMVFAPGGENPRKDIDPIKRPVGIRLTRRNIAIPRILELRRSIYKHENQTPIKNWKQKTSDWKNAFGSSHYQAHMTIIRPGSNVNKKLTVLGNIFRKELKNIYFRKFEIKERIKLE